VWREGRLVRMERSGRLPDRCVTCNRPAAAYRLARKFYWTPPIWRVASIAAPLLALAAGIALQSPMLLALFWPLVLVLMLANAFVRKKLALELGLCPLHRRVRATMIGVSLLALTATIAALAFYVVGYAALSPLVFLSSIGATLLLALIQVFAGVPRVSLRKLNAENAWLAGTGRAFREALPELPR
jgi:hypothetical protein